MYQIPFRLITPNWENAALLCIIAQPRDLPKHLQYIHSDRNVLRRGLEKKDNIICIKGHPMLQCLGVESLEQPLTFSLSYQEI
jgi:hypothetical protein